MYIYIYTYILFISLSIYMMMFVVRLTYGSTSLEHMFTYVGSQALPTHAAKC